jgi:predicted tellurium resistance membrane protein TerC
MELLFSVEAWIALATLTALEIVLGIDNIIFITILVGRLPEEQRQRARVFGLALAMLTRILLLLSLTWAMGLTRPLLALGGFAISGRDVILIGGGLFLLVKSTLEIHSSLEGIDDTARAASGGRGRFVSTLVQIALIDIIFSLDSVITAVGLVRQLPVMVLAIVIAVGVMMFCARAIGDFVDRHPTLKMLALSFLILVGVALVAEGFEFHIPRGYIYFAMAFSVCVEMLNIKAHRKPPEPVHLRKNIPDVELFDED